MKPLIFTTALFIVTAMYAQVGVGNETPRGMLDINDNPSGNATMGLVLPHADDVTTLENPETDAASEVSGTTAFDMTNDCIKFIKNDNTWSECLATGGPTTGGGQGLGASFSNLFSDVKTDLRFTSTTADPNNSSALAISTDKNLYGWGRDNNTYIRCYRKPKSRSNKTLRTPFRINDPNFNGKVEKVVAYQEAYKVLTDDGKIWQWGNRNKGHFGDNPTGTQNSSNGLTTAVELALPAGATRFVDLETGGVARTMVVTDDGKAYYIGATLGAAPDATSLTEIAKPTGVPSDFRYERIWAGHNANFLFLRGTNGKVYGTGRISNASRILFGNDNIPSGALIPITNPFNHSQTNPTQSAGIIEVKFPAGIGTIEKIDFFYAANQSTALALDSNGDIYGWGRQGRTLSPGVEIEIFKVRPEDESKIETISSNKVVKEPVKVAFPEGKTGFRDMVVVNDATAYLTDDGSFYLLGNPSAAIGGFTGIVPFFENTLDDYIETPVTNGFNFNKIIKPSQGSFLYLTPEGEALGLGSSDHHQAGGITGINFARTDLVPTSASLTIPTPIMDVQRDPYNPDNDACSDTCCD